MGRIDSDTTTEGIRVRAVAQFLPDQSNPEEDRFFFSYRVVISNEGAKPARLLSRHWIIIDSDGRRTDVRGPGVVGHTPRLETGDNFEYTSFCPLRTDFGTMEGFYRMQRDDDDIFEAEIGRFYLASNANQPVATESESRD